MALPKVLCHVPSCGGGPSLWGTPPAPSKKQGWLSPRLAAANTLLLGPAGDGRNALGRRCKSSPNGMAGCGTRRLLKASASNCRGRQGSGSPEPACRPRQGVLQRIPSAADGERGGRIAICAPGAAACPMSSCTHPQPRDGARADMVGRWQCLVEAAFLISKIPQKGRWADVLAWMQAVLPMPRPGFDQRGGWLSGRQGAGLGEPATRANFEF